jgi:hypothetical protein
MKKIAFLFPFLIVFPAIAHEGHGLFGSHWHATDVLGFVAVGGLIALALWFSRK